MAEALKINTTLTSIDVRCAPSVVYGWAVIVVQRVLLVLFVVVIVCVCVLLVVHFCVFVQGGCVDASRWRARRRCGVIVSCICRVFVVRRGVWCVCVVSFVVCLVSCVRSLVVSRVYRVFACVISCVCVLSFHFEMCG